MAFAQIPVSLEFSTDQAVKTVGPGQTPMHFYTAPEGYVILNWGWETSGGRIRFDSCVFGVDAASLRTEVANDSSADTVTLYYYFTLLKR